MGNISELFNLNIKSNPTAVVFGRSPYINKVSDLIPALIDKFFSVGINSFGVNYPQVDVSCACDDVDFNLRDDMPLICNVLHERHKHYKNRLPHIIHSGMEFREDKNNLTICVHSPSVAINWLWQQGFKRVVLVGIDLINNSEHFNADYKFSMQQDLLENAIMQLETVIPKYLDVYQANPESKLRIPKIDLKELIKNG